MFYGAIYAAKYFFQNMHNVYATSTMLHMGNFKVCNMR